ncbi:MULTISPECIES: ACP S-malonyltransferase [Eubacteriales]|uniref:Malonyl CoA-acyl carrier protein transacylase n=1 Tax=Bittarella massiliensis (ex Durand et al. 2017) TaxID=1720313 RepID=A0AAQ1ME68_9FIRM|nr:MULTISPECIES: ACP S-malonyltransferase [Eubacteriales]ERI99311.1 [acyl-carrier-protein] S-malonyltransferase [Clostridium sp. ATCC 29733]MZL70755.1 ACP S-malonyltransferase [Bittarella massiliensis (ex Durand et al. 2017)]MZL81576.1 ACP S-malonyltransferase [Bittarella massiliensis (ex Durand et al. 2017)]SHG29849.1 [acyl-carrier-protein] S-malonyltransferase [Bittarella massiliensis (ex Durand et al. 2017)]
MSQITLLFPGQGAQFTGMGQDLCQAYPEAKAVFDLGSQVTGRDLAALCFEGDEATLAKTENAQLAIFAHSMAVTEVLRARRVAFEAAAGFSLGECSALCAAGACTLEQGFALVAARGRLMGEAAAQGGAMAAVMGLTPEQIADCCRQVEGEGYVLPVNFNSPAQTVIAGDPAAVAAACARCAEAGASRTVPLKVSGAFHTRYMEPASDALYAELEGFAFADPSLPVYANGTGEPIPAGTDLRAHLAQQMKGPVQWVKTVENLVRDGHLLGAECGPGKVLTGNGRRISREMKVKNLQTAADVQKFLDEQA